jgi:beta-lactamase class A
MIKHKLLISLLLFVPSLLLGQSAGLQAQLEELVAGFDGQVGIYVEHFQSGETVVLNADSLFPTASMIKIPIMIKIFDLIEKDSLEFRQKMVWHPDTVKYPYDGQLLWNFQPGSEVRIDVLISLMISYSDNHASLWLQKIADGRRINRWLTERGFRFTRVNSRTPGRLQDWERYGWGQTTPREMAQLLKLIWQGKAVSVAADEAMYRFLCNSQLDETALSQIPPYVQVASKQGAVSASRSEVVLVNSANGDYLFCIITKNQHDTSWRYDNAGYHLIRQVSRLLYQYFVPKDPWTPLPQSQKFNQ